MSITRRELLRRASLLGAATLIPSFSAACRGDDAANDDEGGDGTEDTDEGTDTTGGDDLPEYSWDGELGPEGIFAHGVASGDPLADSVILWTRVSPTADEDVELFFEVALDPEFSERVAADYIPEATTAARDYTMKIDLEGLEAATTYYYRFYAQGRVSTIGRTRTAPAGASDHLRMVLCSCSSYGHGYFHAYSEMAGRADLDLIVHVGDYMYEYGSFIYGEVREYDPPHECVTLDDYRRRYRHYRSDPDCAEVHRQHPFVVTWDDHETCNDGWMDGAENHDPDTEGSWVERRAASTQAYFEWLPLREGEPGRVYRQLAYGDLVDLIVLDTRYEGREEQLTTSTPEGLAGMYAEGRQMLGAEQEAWLFERLSSSTSQWKLIAQQVMIGQLILEPGQDGEPNRPFQGDLWDGYDDARRRLLQHIVDEAISDVVVLSGDIHTSFANEITFDPYVDYDPETSEGAVTVEFVTPGITSPGLSLDDATVAALRVINPHNRFVNALDRGYVTLDIKAERIQADWWHFSGGQIGQPGFSGSTHGAAWTVETGTPRLLEAGEPAAEKVDPPVLAP
ncbi:alkaline phosphatase D family protein [Pseudenhygromyxa sp. WMMC2535]|uniref:alkaline phosphatase D family protein n=1 Tax=Pseudenhygromyxa sp. WMMC2535 TaxID=2712867 RepID=UPI0015539F68|nr:alkaline phosphatase D family protein [Pseudenhygromyxa sp. WMMC2535]NVB40046.1 alkaline phosphatase D family protein [Pseudenhygromyxa sp. WMMC2535]